MENTLNSWNKKTILEYIIDKVTDISTLPSVKPTPGSELSKLFADSLEFMEYIMELENTFDVNIPISNDTKYILDICHTVEKELKCKDN